MKILLSALICMLLAKVSLAQSELLSFDEHNKYIYYQVVDMAGKPVDTLHLKGLSFLKKEYPKIKLKTDASNDISGEGTFLTYGGISFLKHEKGEIAYTLNVEFKDQKYRYWLTNFVFTPYQRDRYGNYVPQRGVDIPLEMVLAKLEKKDAEGYLNETGAFCKQFGESLKQYIIMAPVPKKVETPKRLCRISGRLNTQCCI